jgi:hypothetical protein
MALKTLNKTNSQPGAVSSVENYMPMQLQPSSLKRKVAKFLGNLAGVADIPEHRLMIEKPGQVDLANDFLTIKSPEERSLLSANIGDIQGALFSPVVGNTGVVDLIISLKEPDKNALRTRREHYAGTFRIGTSSFDTTYKFLMKHNLVSGVYR